MQNLNDKYLQLDIIGILQYSLYKQHDFYNTIDFQQLKVQGETIANY